MRNQEEKVKQEVIESLEELFSDLEKVLGSLEDESVSIEDAFDLYQKGITMVRQCNERIDRVEKELKLLNGVDEEKDSE